MNFEETPELSKDRPIVGRIGSIGLVRGVRRGINVKESEGVMGTFGWWREGGRPGVIRGGRQSCSLQEGEL